MRRVIIIVAVLFGSPAWALTYMGAPSSNAKQGDLFLGFDYTNSELDFEFTGDASRGILDNVDSDLYLGRAGIGLLNGLEVFGRFGVGEIEDFGNEFAWGCGTKATFAKSGDTSWGVLFQLTSISLDETGHNGDYQLAGDFDVYEYQFAIGPTFGDDDTRVYLGPFLHFVEGDADLVTHGSVDVEQESELGLYLGISWEVADNTHVNLEFQGTDDDKLVGLGLAHKLGGSSD
ncbi:MAG: hypothetical protein JSW27_01250 [Phycisphaerales bacterium]|nr:MAG: hypothetical protein JSW27_01250 [Phycisphaerales bacterium]